VQVLSGHRSHNAHYWDIFPKFGGIMTIHSKGNAPLNNSILFLVSKDESTGE